MTDDGHLLKAALSLTEPVPLFIISEVTLKECKVNGPYTDRGKGNLQRVVSRFGCLPPEQVDEVAEKLYLRGRWESEYEAIQLVAVGKKVSSDLQNRLEDILQLTWDQIAEFLFERFRDIPQKLPESGNPVHAQWPDFGREYGEWFGAEGFALTATESRATLQRYFDSGSCARILR